MTGPLEGFRIVDLTAIVPGPFAADVIKVEPSRIGDVLLLPGLRVHHVRVDVSGKTRQCYLPRVSL